MEIENPQLSDIESNSPMSNIETGTSLNDQQDTPSCNAIVSFNGISEEWIPSCGDDLKPAVGMTFNNLNEGIAFYAKYGKAAGFDIRKATRRTKKDVISVQNVLCNRAGFKENRKKKLQQTSNNEETETEKRKIRKKRLETRLGCKARIVLKLCDDGKFMVTDFVEQHKHRLYTPSCTQFLKGKRKLNIMHKNIIVHNGKMNVGPVKTFRLMKELSGGYENIGASKQEFKNFQRDLKAYINGSDGQMFVDHHNSKKLIMPGYFFEYELDEEDQLCRAFWADPLSIKNYALYGDMVSFDTTYQTNRYNMIFGPFTGVDNHKRCITFCSSFISNEETESFEWVFRTFLKAMSYNEPVCMITDQDGAIRGAIKNIFKKTEHRFCMWHITTKMKEKVGKGFDQYTEFRKQLDAFVWSLEIEPEEFVAGWTEVMSEYGLENHKWLKKLFAIKELWIPAYFRDLFLGGIMRTTSRSESENNFFGRFTKNSTSLLEFNLNYGNAMDAQRHEQAILDNDAKNKKPICETPMKLEQHAVGLFTPTMFYEIQKEIHIACFYCGFQDLNKENGLEIFIVNHKGKFKTFEVAYNCNDNDTTCSCKTFQRQGTPCAHMIWVWKMKMLEKIPEKYVLNRWTTFAAQKPIFDMQGNILEQAASTETRNMLNDLWSEMMMCVSLAETDQQDLSDVLSCMKDLRKRLESKRNEKNEVEIPNNKQKEIEMLIGAPQPTEILVKEPKVSRNKGTGNYVSTNGKRLKSTREQIVEKIIKKHRVCKGCKQPNHDLRNCPQKQKD